MNDISNATDLVSVIVPVYNTAPYVDNCLKSILNQTYGNLEIIVVNDGSTDNSAQVLAAYADNPKVKVLTRVNGGLSAARNTGLEAATGEWVMFIDSDDAIHPELVARAIAAGTQAQADYVRFDYRNVPVERQLDFDPLESPPKAHVVDEPVGYFLAHKLHPSACVICFRRSAMAGLTFEPGLVYEDLDFTWRFLRTAKTGVHIDWQAYNYVQTEGSIIRSSPSRRKPASVDRIVRRIDACYESAADCRLKLIRRKLFVTVVKKQILKPYLSKRSRADGEIADYSRTIVGRLLIDGLIRWIDFSPKWWQLLFQARRYAKRQEV